MSVLIFLDQADGQIKKSSLEAANYGAKVAELLGTSAEAVVLGNVTERRLIHWQVSTYMTADSMRVQTPSTSLPALMSSKPPPNLR